MLQRLLSSGSLRGAIGFALGGVGFALGNILLAAVLPPEQFGLLSLVVALMQFGLASGPIGLEVVVKRHRPRVTAELFRMAIVNTSSVAAAIAVAAALIYHLNLPMSLLLFAGATLAGSSNIAYCIHQSRAEVGWALGLAQGPNYVLLSIAAVSVWLRPQSAIPVLLTFILGYLITNLIGWSHASRAQDGYEVLDSKLARQEGLASVSIGVALQLLWQLERVAIPKLTTVSDLATYSVLAAVVGAPFRVTQFGVGFTLIERLRRAADAVAARRVLRDETTVALLLVVAAAAGVAIAAPFVFHSLLHDKYRIGWDLIAITIAVGVARVAESFTVTVVTALGTARALTQVSGMAWGSLGIGVIAAYIGSRAGLFGIVCGTLFGWLALTAGSLVLAISSFRHRYARVD